MKLIFAVVVLLTGAFLVNSVKVSIYYESLCPDSIRFIVNQLYPAYQSVSSVIEVDFVPYGKANHTLVNGTWEFECQHGEQECFGNKYQACALAQNHSQDINVEFITCVMNASSPAAFQTIFNCASSVNIPFDPINQCFTGDEGDEILAALGDRTHQTQNTQVFVPTITYNDVFTQDLQDLSLTNFSGVFCLQVSADQLEEYCGVRSNSTGSNGGALIASGSTALIFTFLVHYFLLE